MDFIWKLSHGVIRINTKQFIIERKNEKKNIWTWKQNGMFDHRFKRLENVRHLHCNIYVTKGNKETNSKGKMIQTPIVAKQLWIASSIYVVKTMKKG